MSCPVKYLFKPGKSFEPGADARHIVEIGLLHLHRDGRGAVGQDYHVIIQRERVIAAAADAVGRRGPGEDHGIHAETAQYEIERSVEKGGEARLYDAVIAVEYLEFLGKGIRHALVAGLRERLPALKPDVVPAFFNVAAVSPVVADGEDDRYSRAMTQVDRFCAGRDSTGGAGNAQR